jgi:hypothetical protein
LSLQAERVFILNEPGGNIGSSLRNTLDLLLSQREPIVFAAVLHHDDCLAALAGRRQPLTDSVAVLWTLLTDWQVTCPVLSGQIDTAHSGVQWTDYPRPNYEILAFRMPELRP